MRSWRISLIGLREVIRMNKMRMVVVFTLFLLFVSFVYYNTLRNCKSEFERDFVCSGGNFTQYTDFDNNKQ